MNKFCKKSKKIFTILPLPIPLPTFQHSFSSLAFNHQRYSRFSTLQFYPSVLVFFKVSNSNTFLIKGPRFRLTTSRVFGRGIRSNKKGIPG